MKFTLDFSKLDFSNNFEFIYRIFDTSGQEDYAAIRPGAYNEVGKKTEALTISYVSVRNFQIFYEEFLCTRTSVAPIRHLVLDGFEMFCCLIHHFFAFLAP